MYTSIIKLSDMLIKAEIPHTLRPFVDGYQVIINLPYGRRIDAVEFSGSYGYEENLIEIQGAITLEELENDSVLGHLTAEEVFKRFKQCYQNKSPLYVEKN